MLPVLLAISSIFFSTPIPIDRLHPDTINYFLPSIEKELGADFSLQDDRRTKRATREYGYSFFRMMRGDRTFTPIPEPLQQLGERIAIQFGHSPAPFTNVILSMYEEGFHLEPHEDMHEGLGKAFFFDENVYGIIIEPDETGHLFFVCDEENQIPRLDLDPIYSLSEEIGTIYCLQGPFRKAPYFHGVTNVSNRRISITFRTVLFRK